VPEHIPLLQNAGFWVHWDVLLELHWLQVPVVVLQTGVPPVHWEEFDAVHCTHLFVVVLQAGVLGVKEQSLSEAHPTQVPLLQTDAASGQFELSVGVHSTQIPLLLQMLLLEDEQSEDVSQATQVPAAPEVPVAVEQTGVEPEHWLLLTQTWHWFVVLLQCGALDEQFASVRQLTHVPLAKLHTKPVAHWLDDVHAELAGDFLRSNITTTIITIIIIIIITTAIIAPVWDFFGGFGTISSDIIIIYIFFIIKSCFISMNRINWINLSNFQNKFILNGLIDHLKLNFSIDWSC